MADDYSVLKQVQQQEISQTGTGFDDVWVITYRINTGPAKGTVASVTVPEEEHNAAFVKDAIESKVADLTDVASL